ncbi:MAG TPA: methyltransferase domain-containing protein [Sedimenticola sp.]|nr:methyltransferase domain-containing protein [Sedimenticola sp.]
MQESGREFLFTRRDFDFLRRIANERTGIVVGDDKFDMYYARLSRRVRQLGLKDFRQYCNLLKNDKDGDEVLELVNAITTNLTSFFRENHHFEFLRDTILPQLRQQSPNDRRIRIWSAGCSTGEEPYSLAITLKENLPPGGGWDARILATDIDSNVLSRAARGVYSADRVNGIPKPQLRRWFMKGQGRQAGLVRVKPEVRSLIDFGQLNLMEDWVVDGPMDVIFCRNVIIYFDRESKTRLIDRYADNLKDGGYLFVGHSESLFKITDRFELIGNTVYRKKE